MSQLQEKHPLNPFTNRGVITNPDEFFGREQEIGEIVSRLRAMQSSSVVGERRIGKSSLLYHLYQTGRQRIDDTAYRFFYFDLMDARFHTAAGFLWAILRGLELDADAVSGGQSLNRNLVAFSDQIEAKERDGRRLAEWALVEEIAKEHGNFFVGAYDPKQLRRAKKWFSLDWLKKIFETLKAGRDAIKGSDKE